MIRIIESAEALKRSSIIASLNFSSITSKKRADRSSTKRAGFIGAINFFNFPREDGWDVMLTLKESPIRSDIETPWDES